MNIKKLERGNGELANKILVWRFWARFSQILNKGLDKGLGKVCARFWAGYGQGLRQGN